MKTSVFDKKGKEVSQVEPPEAVFGLPWNADLVHQVMVSMESNKRQNNAHTKDRSEVSGGGAKPWKQKGTGRARHGSRRSPIWVGGGVTFGPRNDRNYKKKINKRMKAKALYTVLSKKMKENEILFLDNLDFTIAKTKDAKGVIDSLAKIKGYETLGNKKRNNAFIATDSYDINTKKSFQNFSNIKLEELRNINIIDALKYKYIIMENPEEVFKFLTKTNK
ncbi:MAG: large subunit ribosomal protein L4 [Candidatus Paceibacteria bacterium]|jgi:large subunit ribosomal protein L4